MNNDYKNLLAESERIRRELREKLERTEKQVEQLQHSIANLREREKKLVKTDRRFEQQEEELNILFNMRAEPANAEKQATSEQ